MNGSGGFLSSLSLCLSTRGVSGLRKSVLKYLFLNFSPGGHFPWPQDKIQCNRN